MVKDKLQGNWYIIFNKWVLSTVYHKVVIDASLLYKSTTTEPSLHSSNKYNFMLIQQKERRIGDILSVSKCKASLFAENLVERRWTKLSFIWLYLSVW